MTAVLVIVALAACAGDAATEDDATPDGDTVAEPAASESVGAASDDEDDGGDEPAEPVGAVTFTGTDELTWEPADVSAPAGLVEVTLVCSGAASHALLIEGVNDGRPVAGCLGGASTTKLVALDAGTYTIQCTIAGHSDMTGSLTVG